MLQSMISCKASASDLGFACTAYTGNLAPGPNSGTVENQNPLEVESVLPLQDLKQVLEWAKDARRCLTGTRVKIAPMPPSKLDAPAKPSRVLG